VFLELTLILIGVALASLGWNWGVVTDNRTAWVAVGATGIVLAGITVFSTPIGLPDWSLAALGALGSLVAAGLLRWGAANVRALGMYGLLFAAAAGLSAGGYSKHFHSYSILSLAITLAAVAGALVFVSGLWPRIAILRSVVGWLLVVIGFAIGFLAYGPSIGVTLGGHG
jgi:hypothetical protein